MQHRPGCRRPLPPIRTLRQTDLRSLAALLDSFDHIEPGAFSSHVAISLHTLVPGIVASYNEFGPDHTTVAAVDPVGARHAVDESAFARFAWQHPVLAHFRGAPGQPARAISDYASLRELERLDLYHEVYRPLGIADQISVAVPGPRGLTIGVAMGRGRRGFSERERLLFELLRPHLARGHLHAAHDRHRREAREALTAGSAAAPGRAVVVLTRGARIAWATPPARTLLREWFGYSGGTSLPHQLADWTTRARTRAEPLGPVDRDPSMRLERGARTLTATLLAAPDPDGDLLVVFDQRTQPRAADIAGLGLTKRECEVLSAAARGLGEEAIARELAVSRRTVNKHLEHTYRKLDVASRAEAIAAAFGSAHDPDPAYGRSRPTPAG